MKAKVFQVSSYNSDALKNTSAQAKLEAALNEWLEDKPHIIVEHVVQSYSVGSKNTDGSIIVTLLYSEL